MAGTLTLDHVVTGCCDRGASVRLIGDDHQLGATRAGGVLRDMTATHGAERLDEIVRFPPKKKEEGRKETNRTAASLALRVGDIGALGYYLSFWPFIPDTERNPL